MKRQQWQASYGDHTLFAFFFYSVRRSNFLNNIRSKFICPYIHFYNLNCIFQKRGFKGDHRRGPNEFETANLTAIPSVSRWWDAKRSSFKNKATHKNSSQRLQHLNSMNQRFPRRFLFVIRLSGWFNCWCCANNKNTQSVFLRMTPGRQFRECKPTIGHRWKALDRRFAASNFLATFTDGDVVCGAGWKAFTRSTVMLGLPIFGKTRNGAVARTCSGHFVGGLFRWFWYLPFNTQAPGRDLGVFKFLGNWR